MQCNRVGEPAHVELHYYLPSFAPPKSLRVLNFLYAVPGGSLRELVTDFFAIESLELIYIPFTYTLTLTIEGSDVPPSRTCRHSIPST